MQQIRFVFRVWVRQGFVNDSVSERLEQALLAVSGVERVDTEQRFMFSVDVTRPREETSKQISRELKTVLMDTDGVRNVRLVNWSRY